MNDFLLYAKVRAGDIRSFETLFRRYYEPLCRYGSKIVNDSDTAEDFVQQIFFILWKDRATLRIVLSVKSYLYGAVRNRALQHLEHIRIREQYRQTLFARLPENVSYETPVDMLEYKELEQRLESILERLPKRRRDIYRMNRFEGKKYEQIALEMSLSVKTIEAEMSKVLQTLRKTLR